MIQWYTVCIDTILVDGGHVVWLLLSMQYWLFSIIISVLLRDVSIDISILGDTLVLSHYIVLCIEDIHWYSIYCRDHRIDDIIWLMPCAILTWYIVDFPVIPFSEGVIFWVFREWLLLTVMWRVFCLWSWCCSCWRLFWWYSLFSTFAVVFFYLNDTLLMTGDVVPLFVVFHCYDDLHSTFVDLMTHCTVLPFTFYIVRWYITLPLLPLPFLCCSCCSLVRCPFTLLFYSTIPFLILHCYLYLCSHIRWSIHSAVYLCSCACLEFPHHLLFSCFVPWVLFYTFGTLSFHYSVYSCLEVHGNLEFSVVSHSTCSPFLISCLRSCLWSFAFRCSSASPTL